MPGGTVTEFLTCQVSVGLQPPERRQISCTDSVWFTDFVGLKEPIFLSHVGLVSVLHVMPTPACIVDCTEMLDMPQWSPLLSSMCACVWADIPRSLTHHQL